MPVPIYRHEGGALAVMAVHDLLSCFSGLTMLYLILLLTIFIRLAAFFCLPMSV